MLNNFNLIRFVFHSFIYSIGSELLRTLVELNVKGKKLPFIPEMRKFAILHNFTQIRLIIL